jgi:hypothetical protein
MTKQTRFTPSSIDDVNHLSRIIDNSCSQLATNVKQCASDLAGNYASNNDDNEPTKMHME